jgi:hypothetical protein
MGAQNVEIEEPPNKCYHRFCQNMPKHHYVKIHMIMDTTVARRRKSNLVDQDYASFKVMFGGVIQTKGKE